MRTFKIVCGVAVLINSLHLGHAVHHFFSNTPQEEIQSPFFWAGMALAVVVGILSFIGGCLLLKRGS